jgi:hypothetical protein
MIYRQAPLIFSERAYEPFDESTKPFPDENLKQQEQEQQHHRLHRRLAISQAWSLMLFVD